MSKVTIKDIAKQANVSATTVSNVVNGRSKKVSKTTIDLINKVIEDLNYVPDYSARSLVSKRSRMIGVIIPQTEEQTQFLLENPFYSEIVSGIESKLREHGYYMMLTGVDKDTTYLDVLSNWNLDAVILLGIYKDGLYEQLKKIKVPVLLIDSYIDDEFFFHLHIDDEKGGYMATKYLLDAGHKNIALVTGELNENGVAYKRLMGYKRALSEYDIPFDESRIISDSVSYECGINASTKLIEMDDITAVFCTADLIATGVITGLHNKDVKVPDDISVIGFDNLSISKMSYPALTTINQNIFKKGKRATETILEILDKGILNVQKKQLMDIEIMERDSVKRIEG